MGPANSLGSRLSAIAARLGVSLAFAVVALLLVSTGFGVLVAALWLWLATQLPPAGAAAVTALAVFVLAAVVAMIGRGIARPPARPRVPPAAIGGSLPGAAAASLLGGELGVAGGEWVRANLPRVLLGAVAAGFVLGFSPRLRKALLRLL